MAKKILNRDKTISIKVNSNLVKQFNKIVEENTSKYLFYGKNFYDCLFSDSYCRGKFTLGDLLEKALKDFIEKYSNKLENLNERKK